MVLQSRMVAEFQSCLPGTLGLQACICVVMTDHQDAQSFWPLNFFVFCVFFVFCTELECQCVTLCVCVCVCVFTIQLIVWGGGGGGYYLCVYYPFDLCACFLFCFYYSYLLLCVCILYTCVCLAHPSAIRLDLLWYMSKACVSVYPKDRLRESTYFYLKIYVFCFFSTLLFFFFFFLPPPRLLLRLWGLFIVVADSLQCGNILPWFCRGNHWILSPPVRRHLMASAAKCFLFSSRIIFDALLRLKLLPPWIPEWRRALEFYVYNGYVLHFFLFF